MSQSQPLPKSNSALLKSKAIDDLVPIGIAHEIKSNRIRSKLDKVDKEFIGFEAQLADENRRKRLSNEAHVKEAHESIKRVEKTLNGEIRRRVESNKELHQLAEQMVTEMFERLQKRFAKSLEKLTGSFDSLLTRCESLEKEAAQMKCELPTEIETNTILLVREVHELRKEFEEASEVIADKDNVIFKRLSELEYSVHAKMESDCILEEEQVNDIQTGIDSMRRERTSDRLRFEQFLTEELASLKKGLMLACQAREQSDGQILQAITGCAAALQKGIWGCQQE